MIILEAAELGMCFGVRDALAALDGVADPATVTIHGELVHNGEVLAELDRRGFRRSPENERDVPETGRVMITAHGISDRERRRLQSAGKRLIDTTCPLVMRAHAAARQLQAQGRRVIVIGKPGHIEVLGLTGDLDDPIVVAGLDDVVTWPDRRLGVVCQTTTQETVAEELLAAIQRRNPHAEVRHIDTVCNPTKARITALTELIERVDVLVAVGGRASNNTRQLAEAARTAGIPAHHVECADDLQPGWFAGCRSVGLTAGTSTLDRTIAEVRARLASFATGSSGNGDAPDV